MNRLYAKDYTKPKPQKASTLMAIIKYKIVGLYCNLQ